MSEGMPHAAAMPASTGPARHVFEFRDVRYAVKVKGEEKVLLSNISASLSSGHVLAILGPSGAGKTTLLDVLTLQAFAGSAQGKVQLNGKAMDLSTFQRACALVTQQDFHWAFLTARETLAYAADLYLDATPKEKQASVEKLLADLGLTGCADTKVGNVFLPGLSGGQKRRLSIALALIKSPTVLFLDEPTSGLDAAAAVGVMNTIKELAVAANVAVVCTIHQPSTVVYNSFDQVMVLASGRVSYRGTAEAAVGYFEQAGYPMPNHSNPAEFMLNCVNREFSDPAQVQDIIDKWEAHEANLADEDELLVEPMARELTERLPANPTSFASQCLTLLRRHSLLTLRDPTVYIGRMVAFFCVGVFFALIYVKARARTQEYALQRMWLMMWFVGVPASMGVIVVYVFNEEYKAIRKEWRNGMVRGGAYLTARTLIEVPVMLLLAICTLSVGGYGIANLYAPSFVHFIAMFAAVLWSFEAAAQFFSVQFENPLIGMMSFMNVWFASFLFAGVMIAEKDVIWPFRVLCFIMPLKWGLQGLAYIEYSDATFSGAATDKCPWSLHENPPVGCTYHPALKGQDGFTCPNLSTQQGCFGTTGVQVLESLGSLFDVIESKNRLANDFGITLAICITFKVAYMLLLMIRMRRASRILPPEASRRSSYGDKLPGVLDLVRPGDPAAAALSDASSPMQSAMSAVADARVVSVRADIGSAANPGLA